MKKFLIVMMMFLVSCTPAIITNTPYLDRTMTRAVLQNEGMSVMPVLLEGQLKNQDTLINKSFPEVMGRISQKLGDLLQTRFQNTKVVQLEMILTLFNPSENILEYPEGYILTRGIFERFGIINTGLVSRVAEKAQTRFVVITLVREATSQGIVLTTLLWDAKDQKTVFASTDNAKTEVTGNQALDEKLFSAATEALKTMIDKLSNRLP